MSVRDSAGIRIVENRPEGSADTCRFSERPEVRIGVVEGPEAYQLFRVMDATRLSDGRIAVVNQGSHEIRVYDARGRFLHAFGREGEGPGEFRRVFRIWTLPGDTLLVGDYSPWRFSYFTSEGTFVRTVVPEPLYVNTPRAMGVLADGTFVLGRECCHSEAPGFHERWLHLVRHAPSGEILDNVGVYSRGRQGYLSREMRLAGSPLFEPAARAAAADDRIVVGDGRERELRVLDPEGRLRTIVRWTGPDRTVTSEDVAAYRREILESYRGRPAEHRRYAEPMMSEDRPVNDRFPAHRTILAGEAGDAWVREYERPAWPPDRRDRWLVFGRDGRFLCHARTPPAVEEVWNLFEIGEDYLLAAASDSLRVEYVHLYRLTRPGA